MSIATVLDDPDPLAVELTEAIVNGDTERLAGLLRHSPSLAPSAVRDSIGFWPTRPATAQTPAQRRGFSSTRAPT
jgi:hypothetical protein